MGKRLPTVWPAEKHTIAKIEILKGYLQAWFRILGSGKPGQTILYVDGFAGPGYYTNYNEGSPLAALKVAQNAIHELDRRFVAKSLHGVFIESDRERFEVLASVLEPFEKNPSLGITKLHCGFAEGMERIRREIPGPFRGEGPLFVFADPFGATDIPLKTFADCMQGDTAELLINLDADGADRIFSAVTNNKREEHLTELFGTEAWKSALTARDSKQRSVQILDLYKNCLKRLPGVKFVWSFAMRGRQDTLNYHLVFATKHALGMEKMKEAMRKIDSTGSYSFSDAHAEQHVLFRDDDTKIYAEKLFQVFDGRMVGMEDAHMFALNETPFVNAKRMLIELEKEERVEVLVQGDEKRRAGSFPDGKVAGLRFGRFGTKNAQQELF